MVGHALSFVLTSGSVIHVTAHVREMIAVEITRDDGINKQMPMRLASLMTRSPQTVLPLPFSTAGMLWQRVVRPESWQICSSAVKTVSCASFVLPDSARVLLAGVVVITELVDDVTIARADKRRRLPLASLAWPAAVLPTTCSLPQLWDLHVDRATTSAPLPAMSKSAGKTRATQLS